MELALAAAVVLVAQIVKGTTGFGAALVALPALSVLYGPANAIVLVATVDLFSGTALVIEVWRAIRWRLVLALLIPTIVGMQIGAYALLLAPEQVLLVAMGLVVATMGLRFAIRPVQEGHGELEALPDDDRALLGQAAIAGLVSGVMGASVGAPGPPVVIWARQWFADRFFRAQVIGWLWFTGTGITITLVARGAADLSILWVVPWMLPSVVIGVGFGAWMSPRLSRELFGRAVGVVLIGSGSLLLGRAILQMAW